MQKYKSAQYVHSYLLHDTASYARVYKVGNGEASKSAAVFTPVDNDILDGPFFGCCKQFAVVKKRNVKNKDKKISKKALPTGKGGESLNCIVQLEESELSTNLIFAGKYFCV